MEDKEKVFPLLEINNLKEPVTELDMINSEITTKFQILHQAYNTTPSVTSYVQDLEKIQQKFAENP